MYVIPDTSYALFHIRLLLFWQLGQVRSHKSLLNETQVDFKSSPDCAGYPVLILIVILKIKASVAGQFLSSLGENYDALAHQHHQKTTLWWMGKWRHLRRNSIQRKVQNLPCDPIPFLEGRLAAGYKQHSEKLFLIPDGKDTLEPKCHLTKKKVFWWCGIMFIMLGSESRSLPRFKPWLGSFGSLARQLDHRAFLLFRSTVKKLTWKNLVA